MPPWKAVTSTDVRIVEGNRLSRAPNAQNVGRGSVAAHNFVVHNLAVVR